LTTKENYRDVARFYDLFAGTDDIEYFLGLAERSGGPCLELGVGTGRVALELARRGFRVVGIDVSGEMLAVAEQKLIGATDETKKNLELVESDMRSFNLGEEFGLVYAPGGGFQECLTVEDMKFCLLCVKKHLVKDGTLALAVWMPGTEREYGVRKYERPQVDREGNRVVRSIVWHRPRAEEPPSIDIYYQVFRNSRLAEEYQVSSTVNVLEPESLRRILADQGFTIRKESGDFRGKEYASGDEWMVIVAGRSL
jgi:SAM-dependent methyltransferase